MKFRFFLFLGIFLFPAPLFAELSCEEGDDLCECEVAWSEAFDAVTTYLSENDLTEFLSQNGVASADLWSSYRALSLRNQCFLESVCDLVAYPPIKKDDDETETPLSPETALSGSSPGNRTACVLGRSPSETLSEIPDFSALEKRIATSCSLHGEGEERRTESQVRLLGVYSLCEEHKSVSVTIFNATVRNLIHTDENRKALGYLGKKVQNVLQELRTLVETVNTMVSNINSSFDQLCTVSQPDQQ